MAGPVRTLLAGPTCPPTPRPATTTNPILTGTERREGGELGAAVSQASGGSNASNDLQVELMRRWISPETGCLPPVSPLLSPTVHPPYDKWNQCCRYASRCSYHYRVQPMLVYPAKHANGGVIGGEPSALGGHLPQIRQL